MTESSTDQQPYFKRTAGTQDTGVNQHQSAGVVTPYATVGEAADFHVNPGHEVVENIAIEQFQQALGSCVSSSRFFSVTHPELDNLRSLLNSGDSISKSSIENAITSARSSIGSKSHRISIFNNPN